MYPCPSTSSTNKDEVEHTSVGSREIVWRGGARSIYSQHTYSLSLAVAMKIIRLFDCAHDFA